MMDKNSLKILYMAMDVLFVPIALLWVLKDMVVNNKEWREKLDLQGIKI